MMGPTHALGGAAALAAYTIVTGDTHVPVWGFGLAAISALIPDTDLPRSILNRFPLIIAKLMAYPIWWGKLPPHRGRTHSLASLVFFVLLLAGWMWLFTQLGALMDYPTDLSYTTVLIAGGVGYASHLALDLLNVSPGIQLLWPLPFRFVFPPFGRFKADSTRSHLLIHLPMTIFLCWYAIEYRNEIIAASTADTAGGGVIGLLIGIVVGAFKTFITFLGSVGG